MRQPRLPFWCDLTIWPLAALACLAGWIALIWLVTAAMR
jgi:hypothetical protein